MNYRRAVLNAFLKVTRDGAFANLAAKEELSAVRPTDIGRSTALLYTAIDNLNYSDHVLSYYIKGRVHTSVRGILRLATAEIFFMNTPPHAVCSESVKLAAEIGKPQLKGYVNGVLRNILRDKEAGALPALPEDTALRLNIQTGYPLFIIKEHIARFGEARCEAMLTAAVNETALRAVYPNDVSSLMELLDTRRIVYRPSPLDDAVIAESLGGLLKDEAFLTGRFTVQSIGAMLACRCLGIQPGMSVLDCCAAPGGKTAYIFDLMRRDGSVTAWDIHPHRVELIKNTLERLNIKFASKPFEEGVHIACADASVPRKELVSAFDAVLCDVPCSGLGGGSKPDAKLRRTEESVSELAELQLKILTACGSYVKPDGTVVYSTCTISEMENEGVVKRFLEQNPGFAAVDFESELPLSLAGRGAGGMLTLFPDIDRTEGFFIAKLRRLG